MNRKTLERIFPEGEGSYAIWQTGKAEYGKYEKRKLIERVLFLYNKKKKQYTSSINVYIYLKVPIKGISSGSNFFKYIDSIDITITRYFKKETISVLGNYNNYTVLEGKDVKIRKLSNKELQEYMIEKLVESI